MNVLITYQWEIFIILEVLSVISLLAFGFVGYMLGRKKLSYLFIGGFLFFLICEAVLSLVIYRETGEFSTFQMVIIIFILYACTFGIGDFKRLDRWMRKTIGNWRGLDLLTERDYFLIERNKNPQYLARKYRITSTIHLFIFIIAQAIFWSLGTNSLDEFVYYIKDLSWIQSGQSQDSPYPNDTLYGIGMIWGIVFIVDFIWSWSYTIFPSKEK